MRRKKERSKQGQTSKQGKAHMYRVMRDEKEERKKQARSNKQTRQSTHVQGYER